MKRQHLPSPARQRGISLLIVLILLLITTVLGLAVLRGTLLEERMAANLYDRSLSFQAVESALRQGEAIAAAAPAAPGAGCNGAGICAIPASGALDRWNDPSFAGWVTATAAGGALAPSASYIVEFLGEAPTWPGCDRLSPMPSQCLSPNYRITARSVQAGRAQVILQSNFIVQ